MPHEPFPVQERERISAGGPRFWRERSNEIRKQASVWAWQAGWLTIPAKIARWMGSVTKTRLTAAEEDGLYGHLSRTAAVLTLLDVLEDCCATAVIVQWCLPWRRQHTGTFASAMDAAKSGETSGSVSSSKSEMETNRRTGNSDAALMEDREWKRQTVPQENPERNRASQRTVVQRRVRMKICRIRG